MKSIKNQHGTFSNEANTLHFALNQVMGSSPMNQEELKTLGMVSILSGVFRIKISEPEEPKTENSIRPYMLTNQQHVPDHSIIHGNMHYWS